MESFKSLEALLPTSLFKELQQNCLICRPGGSGNWPHCECHELLPPYGGEDGWNRLGYKIDLLYKYLLELSEDLDKLRTTLEAVQKVYPQSFKDGINTVFTIDESDNPINPNFHQTTLMDGVVKSLGTPEFNENNINNLLALGSEPVKMEMVEQYCRDYDYKVVKVLLAVPAIGQYRSEDPEVNEFLEELRNE